MDTLIDPPAISPGTLTAEAWAAVDHREWDAALERWAVMRASFPQNPDGYVWPVHTLWLAGRLDEAEAMAAELLLRFPRHPDALIVHAHLAEAAEDWAEAVRRWRRALAVAADRSDVSANLAASLRRTRRLDEAETTVKDSLRRHPDSPALLIENVWLAVLRGKWVQAESRARLARERLTALGRDSVDLNGAEYRISLHRKKSAPADHTAANSADDQSATAAVMLAFESIGRRCDLGLAQRHFGANPISLLRFAYVPHDGLIAALEARFEGVGGTLTTFERSEGELVANVDRYGLSFHTFIYENELTIVGKHEKFTRRWLAHLKDKLINDLKAGEKIFVYANSDELTDGDILKLFALIRSYGPSRLLCVNPANAAHPDGEVSGASEPGLYIGYLDRFAAFESGEQPSFASWRRICERTLQIARG